MSVILVTGSYDHEIRFWEAWSGICSRTIARSGESGVSSTFSTFLLSRLTINISKWIVLPSRPSNCNVLCLITYWHTIQQTSSSCSHSQKGLHLWDYQRILDTSARVLIFATISIHLSHLANVPGCTYKQCYLRVLPQRRQVVGDG
jgi:hypothetical protein